MRHEALLYRSDQEFLDTALPFLHEGLDTGEFVMVNTSEHNRALLTAALGNRGIAYEPLADQAHHPARTLTAFVRILERAVAGGGRGVRAITEVARGKDAAECAAWARYEAAVNVVLSRYPVSALCPYDLRSASAASLDGAERTHPSLHTADARYVNSKFEDPADYLRRSMTETPPDPLTATDPVLTAGDVTDLAVVRDEVYLATLDTKLPGDAVDDFVFAVSEVLTNALQHGDAPVRLRLWQSPTQLVCEVIDHGPGIENPFTGYTPPPQAHSTDGAIGLWMAHQLCDSVTWRLDETGSFCVTLTVRA